MNGEPPTRITIALLATRLAITLGGCGSTPPPVTAQCRHDIAVWNGFVSREVAAGYPDVPVAQG